MAFLHKILRTSVYIVEDDTDFLRVLKQVFARGVENHKIFSFHSADDLLEQLRSQTIKKIRRNVVIISVSVRANGTHSVFETIETVKQYLFNTHVILIYNPGELENEELERYKAELLVDDIITKNNFARMRIQNAIRRILSRDDFEWRRKLLWVSAAVASFFLVTTVLFYFIA